MGKHTKRTPGYLPRMAAGAAPLALLLAGPATAQADPRAPLDLHQSGTSDLHLTRDEKIATRDLPVSAASALHQAVAPDTVGQAQSHDLRLGSPGRAFTGNDLEVHHRQPNADSDLAGAGQSMRHGVRLPHGVDALSDSTSGADAGLAGRFSGDLRGGARVHRTSADAVDLGELGSVVANSDENVLGQFAGNLDVTRLETQQRHVVGGDLGPAHALVATSQSTSELADRFHGELAAEDIAAVQATTSTNPGHHAQQVRVSALGQPSTGWTLSGPPFIFSPG
ncbi:hypothetical protein [Amycolatopsis jejuensis]|uniref:hypothetical protein n=1 Tax=Amycolatopsis jejuensis TaxID=330084 RepID=UPI001B80E085|nr:hypothetical protein [Amycolatopsis jejuensis]